jgi:Alginate export
MRNKSVRWTAGISHALYGIIVGSLCIGDIEPIQAAEKKTYTRAPFVAFSSQMPDALLGSDRYEKPVWNLHDTLGLPDWLSVSLEQRTRYESLDGTFKGKSTGGDQQIALQTDLWLEARLGSFRFGTEFLDARAVGADTGSVEMKNVTNTQVDTADFLQGYAAWSDQNIFYSGIGTEVIVGRQTLNFGSRRLLARNAFRNAINSFTGLRFRLMDYANWQFNGFVTMPVIRYPTDGTKLLNDVHQWDEEDTHTVFSGGFLEVNNFGWDINTELYLYHLAESNSIDNPNRSRHYFTPGTRSYIKPAKDKFDFQFEVMGQFGTVHETTAINSRKLDHAAWSHHMDVGYTFGIPWSPRFALEYDYASGDNKANDGNDQRFDPLYGARRFDFGPTGIYGAFSRSNINTPGLRINANPRSDVQLTLAHRAFWLASANDCWGGSSCSGSSLILQPKKGGSNDFVGQQLEMSARWDYNSSLNFETGWAHLFKGQFAKQAASASNTPDTDYFYVQTMLRF